MLNLFDPVIFTGDEKRYIDTYLKPLGKEGWKDATPHTIAIKHHISEHTIIAQGGRCAYCEKVLAKGDVDIEHIAPKRYYGEFTFEPFNLVASCTCCNSPVNKGQNKTIVGLIDKNNYDLNKFSIVHSYIDTPDDHIKYLDNERTLIDYNNCSQKGKDTIKMFHWDETWAYYKRQEIASLRRFPIDVLKIAAEIATYN